MRLLLDSVSQDSQLSLIKSAYCHYLVAMHYKDAYLHRVALSPIGYLSHAPMLKDPSRYAL